MFIIIIIIIIIIIEYSQFTNVQKFGVSKFIYIYIYIYIYRIILLHRNDIKFFKSDSKCLNCHFWRI